MDHLALLLGQFDPDVHANFLRDVPRRRLLFLVDDYHKRRNNMISSLAESLFITVALVVWANVRLRDVNGVPLETLVFKP